MILSVFCFSLSMFSFAAALVRYQCVHSSIGDNRARALINIYADTRRARYDISRGGSAYVSQFMGQF